MGDKIGDYIHYKYSNYLRYGLGTREYPEGKPNISAIYNDQRRKILEKEVSKKITEKSQLDTLENNLNFFRNPNQGTTILKWTNEQQDIQNEIARIITQALKLDVSNFDFNTMSWTSPEADNFFERGGRKDLSQKGQSVYGESIQQRLNIMTNSIDRLESLVSKGQISQSDATYFKNQLNKLQNLWAELQNELSYSEGKGLKQFSGSVKNYNISNSIKGQTFVWQLNSLWEFGKKQMIASIKGEAAEYWSVLTNYVLANFGTSHLQEALEYLKGINGNEIKIDLFGGVGRDRSSAALNKDFFASTGKNKRQVGNFDVFTNFGIANAAFHSTQNKVDIKVNLDNLIINGSVKNYSASTIVNHGYTLHTGSSILALVQEYGNFVNHYLNVTASHAYVEAGPSGGNIREMQDAMKLTIVLKALQGGIFKVKGDTYGKSEEADVFITVENGLYKVYSMTAILNNIAKNINLAIVKGLPEDVPVWKQVPVGDYWFKPDYHMAFSRINKLLNLLHKAQLKISISPQALS